MTNKKTTHTPGPWRLENNTDSKYDFIIGSNQKVICQLFNRADSDFDNKIANARLIAAAPAAALWAG